MPISKLFELYFPIRIFAEKFEVPMNQPKQLTVPSTPKARGGDRPSAGRKKSTPDTVVVRVCAAIADDCRALDDEYRRRYAESRELDTPTPEPKAS